MGYRFRAAMPETLRFSHLASCAWVLESRSSVMRRVSHASLLSSDMIVVCRVRVILFITVFPLS
jgi:hypothetical protein